MGQGAGDTRGAGPGGGGTVRGVGGVVAVVVGPVLVGQKSDLVSAVDGGGIASPRLAWLAWLVVVARSEWFSKCGMVNIFARSSLHIDRVNGME